MTNDIGPEIRNAISTITEQTAPLPAQPPQHPNESPQPADRWLLAAATAAVLLVMGLSVVWISRPTTIDVLATEEPKQEATQDTAPGPATLEESNQQHTPNAGAAAELRSDVRAFIFPLNAAEIGIGEASSGLSGWVEVRLARCIADAGFNELAALIEDEAGTSPRRYSDWIFPDLDYLTNHRGLTPEQAAAVYNGTAPAVTLFNWVSPSGSATDFAVEGLTEALRSNESYGTAPEDAVDLLDAMTTCETAPYADLPVSFEQREELLQDWLAEVDTIENSAAMKPVLDDLLVCVRDIDPRIPAAETAFGWFLERVELATTLLDDPNIRTEDAIQTAWEWDEQYAACLGPVEAQRTALRSGVRDQLVQQRLPELIEFQETLLAETEALPDK